MGLKSDQQELANDIAEEFETAVTNFKAESTKEIKRELQENMRVKGLSAHDRYLQICRDNLFDLMKVANCIEILIKPVTCSLHKFLKKILESLQR